MKCLIALSFAFFATLALSAAQTFQLYSCVDEWDGILNRYGDALKELELGEGLLRGIDEEIAAVDGRYPFLPKASSLQISEFETEEDFNLRVKRQQKADEQQKRQAISSRDTERRKLAADRAERLEDLIAKSNLVSKIANEWFAFTNKEWRSEIQMSAADLPYFNREAMAFLDIPSPFVSHSDEGRGLRFEVPEGRDSVSLKFRQLKDAEAFKNGLLSGSVTATFVCTFTLGLPQNCIIRAAWTERQERGALEKVGIGALLVAAAALASNYSENNYSYGTPSYNSGGDLWHKEVKHPEIKGRSVPVHLRKCWVEIKGLKTREVELSSTSENWKLQGN